MKNVGLFEAKQRLSGTVERARADERIGITRRGQLAAWFSSGSKDGIDPREAFAGRKKFVESALEEGRR